MRLGRCNSIAPAIYPRRPKIGKRHSKNAASESGHSAATEASWHTRRSAGRIWGFRSGRGLTGIGPTVHLGYLCEHDLDHVLFFRDSHSGGGGGGGYQQNKRKTNIKRPPKRDPIYVDGQATAPDVRRLQRSRPALRKLTNRHGRIVSRRKTGCHAASQHAVARAIKRARFMALLPYVGD